MKKQKTSKFEVDFFLLEILTEACWHAGTIVRAMFLEDLVEVYYHNMSEQQKASFWTFLKRFNEIESNNFNRELHYLVRRRFNPETQYEVTVNFNGKIETYNCFSLNVQYHVSKTKFIAPEFIIEVKQISASM